MSNKKIERINDSQLSAQLNAIRAHIRRTRKHNGDTRDAEVELCYLERELEHRERSKKIDKAYKERLKEEEEAFRKEAQEEEEAIKEYFGKNYA